MRIKRDGYCILARQKAMNRLYRRDASVGILRRPFSRQLSFLTRIMYVQEAHIQFFDLSVFCRRADG